MARCRGGARDNLFRGSPNRGYKRAMNQLPDPIRTSIAGVLLAGGQSRRMFAGAGGGDKGLLDLGDQPMLGHVIARFAPQVGTLVINANGDPARFARFGLPVAGDTLAGFPGPLAGVLAGMRWTATHAADARYVATVSTDAPFLPDDLVARLHAAIEDKPGHIAIAQSADGLHPVIGLWPVALADDLEAALAAGVRKVLAWTDRHGTVPVVFEPVVIGGKQVDPFFNANTPDEMDAARRLLGKITGRNGEPVIGIAGWKNSGKTTLTVALVAEFARRGLRVATLKHAHHDFQIDDADTDSARHRRAGAQQVMVVSAKRWAIVRELAGGVEPDFADALRMLEPCDLIIVEGYKSHPIPKIEARRTASTTRTPLSDTDPHVIAIAADHPVAETKLPVFALDDAPAIADFIARHVGLAA